MHKSFLIVLLLPIIISCTSTTESIKEGAEEKEETYNEKGMALLALPHEDRFFSFINTTLPDSPGSRDTLLEHYRKNQEELVSFFFNKGDIFKALHYYKNLFAVKEIPEEERDAFYRQIDEKAGEAGYKFFRKHLKLTRGWDVGEEDFSSLQPVTEYNFVLTEITVKREYINKDGVLRMDHPHRFGSGIVIDSRHILTTFHLVEDIYQSNTKSYEIAIKQDQMIFSNIKVSAWDSLLGIAILETEEDIQYIPDFHRYFGDSRTIQKGQSIFCLGHHAGYTSTLTKGIVSADERTAPEGGTWIQVDASVTPGAEGGVLLGEDGRIYGMILGGIAHENINFILPSNLILSVTDQLLHRMKIKRPWLGIQLTKKKELEDKVYINGLFPSSPLTETEIKADDQLVAINNVPVTSVKDARAIMNTFEAGNLIQVRFQNSTGEIIRYVHAKRRPDYPAYSAIKNAGELVSFYIHFGFSVDQNIKDKVRFTIKEKKYTINFHVVTQIKKDSHLDKMGVKVGDLLGILADFYIQRTRYLEVFHIPADRESHQPDYVEDYIYRMKKEEYDENVL
jgi:S1-C subfamily serine protease